MSAPLLVWVTCHSNDHAHHNCYQREHGKHNGCVDAFHPVASQVAEGLVRRAG